MVPLTVLFFAPLSLPLWLDHRRRHRLARLVAIWWSCVMIPTMGYLAGPDTHVELGLLVTVAGTIVLLDPADPQRRVVTFLPIVSVIALVVAQHLMPFAGLVPVPFQDSVFVSVVIVVMLNVIGKVSLLREESERRAQRLQRV